MRSSVQELLNSLQAATSDEERQAWAVASAHALGLGGIAISYGHELVWFSDDTSARLEDLQFVLGQGPSQLLGKKTGTQQLPDLTRLLARRWPQFAAEAEELGVAALFVWPVHIGAVQVGTMTGYRRTPGPLSAEQLAQGWLVADALAQQVLPQQAISPLVAVVPDGGADLLAASGALRAEVTHQPGDGAPGHRYAFAMQLPPDHPDPVDAEVVREDTADLRLQLRVAQYPSAGSAVLRRVVGARRVLDPVTGQDSADRLDSEHLAVGGDERYERFDGRSSSAAKKAEAALRIAFALRSSAFSAGTSRRGRPSVPKSSVVLRRKSFEELVRTTETLTTRPYDKAPVGPAQESRHGRTQRIAEGQRAEDDGRLGGGGVAQYLSHACHVQGDERAVTGRLCLGALFGCIPG